MKVLLAVPHTGNIRAELVQRILSLETYGHEVRFFLSWGRPICSNRNHIVNIFLETGFDFLLQIDSDIEPCPEIIQMVNNNLDICSADIHTAKGKQLFHLGLRESEDGGFEQIDLQEGLNEVEVTGTGCLLVKKEVFLKMQKPYFEDVFNDEGILECGEDFNFCKKARELGFKISYDTRFKTNHYSSIPL